MLDRYDILIIIAINFAVNLAQPIINNLCMSLFKKVSSKILGSLLKRAAKELPIKPPKLKKNPTASEALQHKGLNFIQTSLPLVIDKFQKSGIDGVVNMASEKINSLLKPKTQVPQETVQVEDITSEMDELQKYRLEKAKKVT
jgi:hypothetical protein